MREAESSKQVGRGSEAAQLARARRALRYQIRARFPVERLTEQLEGRLVPGPLFEQVRLRIEALRLRLAVMGADPDNSCRDAPPACAARAQIMALIVRLRACGRTPGRPPPSGGTGQEALERLGSLLNESLT